MDTRDRLRLSAVARLEAALDRIQSAKLEGGKAFSALFADSARREAEAADQRVVRRTMRGPLDGRIVSVKSLFDVEDS